jgi:hypothetical protein
MDSRKAVYAKDWLDAHKDCLRRHPRYRPEMEYTEVSATGALTIHTRDKPISADDQRVFEEVGGEVARTHRFIQA